MIVDLNPATWPNPDAHTLLSGATRSTWYEQLYADHWYALYRIRWENFDPSP